MVFCAYHVRSIPLIIGQRVWLSVHYSVRPLLMVSAVLSVCFIYADLSILEYLTVKDFT